MKRGTHNVLFPSFSLWPTTAVIWRLRWRPQRAWADLEDTWSRWLKWEVEHFPYPCQICPSPCHNCPAPRPLRVFVVSAPLSRELTYVCIDKCNHLPAPTLGICTRPALSLGSRTLPRRRGTGLCSLINLASLAPRHCRQLGRSSSYCGIGTSYRWRGPGRLLWSRRNSGCQGWN